MKPDWSKEHKIAYLNWIKNTVNPEREKIGLPIITVHDALKCWYIVRDFSLTIGGKA